jgi:hypothetical protein
LEAAQLIHRENDDKYILQNVDTGVDPSNGVVIYALSTFEVLVPDIANGPALKDSDKSKCDGGYRAETHDNPGLDPEQPLREDVKIEK